jgi:hypothetical protein
MIKESKVKINIFARIARAIANGGITVGEKKEPSSPEASHKG